MGGIAAAGAGFVVGGPAGAVAGYSLYQTGESIRQQKKAQKATRKARKAQRRLSEIATARERRKAAAAARSARARAVSEAAATGTIGTSAVSGALSSISAQAAERIGFSKVQTQIGGEVAGFEAKAGKAQSKAATARALAGVPGQLGLTPSFAGLGEGKETE